MGQPRRGASGGGVSGALRIRGSPSPAGPVRVATLGTARLHGFLFPFGHLRRNQPASGNASRLGGLRPGKERRPVLSVSAVAVGQRGRSLRRVDEGNQPFFALGRQLHIVHVLVVQEGTPQQRRRRGLRRNAEDAGIDAVRRGFGRPWQGNPAAGQFPRLAPRHGADRPGKRIFPMFFWPSTKAAWWGSNEPWRTCAKPACCNRVSEPPISGRRVFWRCKGVSTRPIRRIGDTCNARNFSTVSILGITWAT